MIYGKDIYPACNNSRACIYRGSMPSKNCSFDDFSIGKNFGSESLSGIV